MKKLIVAEKPSVAKTIASVVGADKNNDGYVENESYIVTWCFGHLLENAPPETYNPLFKKWQMETLPIVPDKWLYLPIEEQHSKKQLGTVVSLMRRRDVSSFIEATDAGREGELIFRLVYEYAGTNKPFERLWISSLESSAIRAGLANLKPSRNYDNLYQAALSRSRADWLFGINGTRFYTIAGCMGNEKATVGRVQTPTLAMIVERQREIENFKVEKRFVVQAPFDGDKWRLETEKIDSENLAQKCVDECENKTVTITDVSTQKKFVSPPHLFSLTSLQRDMNRRFGFSADHTLKLIQGLYERKILSYPRTDSEFITSDMKETFLRIISNIEANKNITAERTGINRIIDDKKVSDHYAIIVTELYSKKMKEVSLSQDEQCVVEVITQRMFESISQPYSYMSTSVTGVCDSYTFKGTGSFPLDLGWKKYNKIICSFNEQENEEKKQTPNVFPESISPGQIYLPDTYKIVSRNTKPPQFFTEDTLLGAMEKAGAKEMDKEVERKGLGTSATRAEIIEKLLRRKYIVKEKKLLKATELGCHLIDSVSDGFKSVSTTVEWENRLLEIERGTTAETCNSFCESITNNLRQLISIADKTLANSSKHIGPCPWCGSQMYIVRGVAKCECGKRIYMSPIWMKKDLSFTIEQMDNILKGNSAPAVLVARNKKEYPVTASIDFEKTKSNDYIEWKIDFSGTSNSDEQTDVGKCIICGGNIILKDGVASCSQCNRRIYAKARWMTSKASFTTNSFKSLFAGEKVKSRLKAKTGKEYNVNVSLDKQKTESNEKYFEVSFEFLQS